MTYDQAIDFLYTQLPMFSAIGAGAYKPGLGNARLLDYAFGNCHAAYKCLHVAGTNGKGSTSHALASVLQEAGYKVGLYTSPHLTDFKERIRVNGEKITEAEVVDFVERYLGMHLECKPSFFELTTIMAFEHFKRHNVDFAVIEVGLGGRLDTTNIITPVLSVITNISLEHTSLLGDTLQQIAYEKGGIIKDDVPVVIGEATAETRSVFQNLALEHNAPIVFAQDNQYADVECDLDGPWQKKNMNTVMHALQILRERGGVSVSDDAIKRGLSHIQENTAIRGRWMHLSHSPEVVADSGHNPGAWKYLSKTLNEIAAERQLHAVLGFSDDKDVKTIFSALPKNAVYYLVQPQTKRAMTLEALLEVAKANNLDANAYESVSAGYEAALASAGKDDFVFVGGSFYVLAEIL